MTHEAVETGLKANAYRSETSAKEMVCDCTHVLASFGLARIATVDPTCRACPNFLLFPSNPSNICPSTVACGAPCQLAVLLLPWDLLT
jgi:hypothetical protein